MDDQSPAALANDVVCANDVPPHEVVGMMILGEFVRVETETGWLAR